ncbi:2-C-methyl-D-erythritol 4-phosphate cytidylyltransferase [Synechococcus sp. PCC 7502]|uniref:2-C-methyl-D-erythritol 4-phosphate cytidylyltransferase n=1 Tax=Synechococcus sp. PCC 7502 TaxID=1173263 RepID=UPI00029FF3A2|nr:2-C-methyl-D-erythritol 4-phosphate cytidylyltransferase [Synechococcus sp. PCC 7502]AFY74091.1 2-C-methyl-D-erythritol 4-phosphate cytidylyltransferase [Synechococcus sp. PCC 7502]
MISVPTCELLIPAAGSGRRMGSDRNKLLLPLLGKPILQWTLEAAISTSAISWIGVIGQPYDFPAFREIFAKLNSEKIIILIQGGDTRQASVFNGLNALPANSEYVLIHDGARCLATPDLFTRCAEALQTYLGLIAAIQVKDTIKVVNDGIVQSTPDRNYLWAAQTPQGFAVKELKQAHFQAQTLNWAVTDDAALFEKIGLPVQIVMGEETNLKITTPQDLAIAEFILKQRSPHPLN